MPKIDIDKATKHFGTRYPPPFDKPCRDRKRWALSDVAGLTQFGVNLMRLAPGVWTSQRHWHTAEDEFVFVVEGEVVLVTDEGETVLKAGDCAGFKAGEANGHHIKNHSGQEAVLLEIGTRAPETDEAFYSDIDMMVGPDGVYRHQDSTPYEVDTKRRR